ncbi:serine/threonine protein kinase [Acinetobacter pittii]|uniref:AAA domain-containing protein n=3 Tax=Acinetobacter calcoaceticus/baumannii complex TaxID=909768 RepID=UPI0002E81547|nr:AAA domain-containing protein [Acinetobacter pittii]SSP30064.1 serine/threonine protein kinase [Acinetobacter pittii]
MELKILGGAGLHKSELKAIDLIEQKFTAKWKGYAGIVLTDSQGSMEIDLLLITNDRILVVELKEWNGKLESNNGMWFVNGNNRGTSPYVIKRMHARRIKALLSNELSYKLKGYSPHVEAHVVLCGTCTKEHLTKNDQEYTHHLEDFLKLQKNYNSIVQDTNMNEIFTSGRFERPNSDTSLKVFDEFFLGKKVKPLNYEYHDYQAKKESEYIHPKKLFEEFEAHHKETRDIAILRRWDFEKLGSKYASQELWSEIILREHRLKSYVEDLNDKLGDYFLNPMVVVKRDDILSDTSELYRIRKTEKRIGNIVKELESFTEEKRYDVVRALLKPIADLHTINIAHRDLGTHNIVYSRVSDKVIFTQFFSSYFQEKGTITNYRDILKTNTVNLPEDVYDDKKDPFKMDVFLLGVVCYFIISKGNMLKNDSDGIPVWIEIEGVDAKINSWLEKALSFDSHKRYENALEMLEEFNKINEITSQNGFNYLVSELNKGNFLNNKNYKDLFMLSIMDVVDDKNNKETQNYCRYKINYKDRVCVVKWWNPLHMDEKNISDCRKILDFKNRIEKLQSSNVYTTKFLEHGYIGSHSHLYLIYEYIEGVTLSEYLDNDIYLEDKKNLAKQLITNVINLHHLGIYHGDLHSDNIIISEDGCYLIDVVDVSFGSEKFNNEFIDINPTAMDGFGRDIYTTYKIVEKIFQNEDFDALKKEISLGFSSSNGIPVSLDPLIDILSEDKLILENTNNIYISSFNDLDVLISNFISPSVVDIETIDGKYLFNFKQNKENDSIIDCYITGLNYYIKLSVDVVKRSIEKVYSNPSSFADVVSAESRKCEELICNIKISKGDIKKNESLVELIFNLESVIDYLEEKYSIESEISVEQVELPYIPISKIWTTLAETEEEIRDHVIINTDEIKENNDGNFVIPYYSENDNSFEFDYDEIVKVYDKDNYLIGDLVIRDTNLDFLTVKLNRKFNSNLFKPGGKLVLESIRNKASRDRRLKALNRVINNNSVIRNLPSYFDENSEAEIIVNKINDNLENFNDKFSINNEKMSTQQLDNFKKILEISPISVLQGPPGTGKTSFISKFINYLFEEIKVKNILLVSQSHTAVDNVVAKTKQLFDLLGNELNIVRLGQESMMDSEILPYSPPSIQRQILSKFDREYEQRILSLANYISLPRNFIMEITKVYKLVGAILIAIDRSHFELKNEKAKGNRKDKIEEIENTIKDKLEIIQEILHSKYQHNFEFELYENYFDEIISYFSNEYSINNEKELKKLKNLLKISDDWISVLRSDHANFDKFLVKSKQLVCGTLVGIGKNNIQIENVEFDWVIIDEAARAQASELMIAMQSGKRVLLVGDHKQLPPHYHKKHIKLAAKKLNESINIFDKHDFEKVFKKTGGITLNTQYRMVKPICHIISEVFYPELEGGLQTGRSSSPEWYDLLNGYLKKPVIWLDSSSSQSNEVYTNPGYYNESEVILIKQTLQNIVTSEEFLKHLINDKARTPHPIGIITLYKAQKDKVESMISQTDSLQPLREYIKVDTVDSYQGQQNSIIVLSLVRDNPEYTQGFLQYPERINVALSRAQERLVIIGSRKMWSQCNEDSPLYKVHKVIEKYALDDSVNFEIIESI